MTRRERHECLAYGGREDEGAVVCQVSVWLGWLAVLGCGMEEGAAGVGQQIGSFCVQGSDRIGCVEANHECTGSQRACSAVNRPREGVWRMVCGAGHGRGARIPGVGQLSLLLTHSISLSHSLALLLFLSFSVSLSRDCRSHEARYE
jgi:hypothetical protein